MTLRIQLAFGVADANPREYCDAKRDEKKNDERDVVEPVVEIYAQTGQEANKKGEHFPWPCKYGHGEDGDDERRVGANEVGQLQAVVVEYAKREEVLIASVIELKKTKSINLNEIQIIKIVNKKMALLSRKTCCRSRSTIQCTSRGKEQ